MGIRIHRGGAAKCPLRTAGLLAAVLLCAATLGAGPAAAGLHPVGSPVHIGSWVQSFNESGVGTFDRVAIHMLSGGPFDVPAVQTGFSADAGTWAEGAHNTAQSVATGGPGTTNLTWGIAFAGSQSVPLAFEFIAYDGATELENAFCVWNGSGWNITNHNPPQPNTVFGEAPLACLTAAHNCLTIPVDIVRADPQQIQGYSVNITLSPGLQLCGTGITQGSYLGGSFYVTGTWPTYTVDGAQLGPNCGNDADVAGTLFNVQVKGITEGAGSVTIGPVTARDCTNGPIALTAGPAVPVTVDFTAPTAIASLAAVQQLTLNPAGQTTNINLSWPATEAGSTVQIYRAGYGGYPLYVGGVPSPATAPAGWALAGTVGAPTATFTDLTAQRDFYYYVAFVTDACGNTSTVSNMTGGTLNYHLGDVTNGATLCTGNNLVDIDDITFLGNNYGHASTGVECLDVGPTTNYLVSSRPVPDGRIGFEDLILFSINFGPVSSAPQMAASPASTSSQDRLMLDVPASVTAGQTFTATLRMTASGALQGLSTQLGWDPAVATPVAMTAGDLITSQNGVVFSAQPGNVDAAVLGTNRTITGDGVVAKVTFQALAAGNPGVTLAKVDARDVANRRVTLAAGVPTALPTETMLMPVAPNPVRANATLAFSLARAGKVELAIYSVDGRRVRTLVQDTREPGVYRTTWNGTDDAGNTMRSGVFFARLTTVSGNFSKALTLVR